MEKGPCGPIIFVAPEQLEYEWYDYKADVFSFATTLVYLLEGCMVDSRVRSLALQFFLQGQALHPDLDEIPNVPPFLATLMEHCWDQDPEGRPSFQEIVELLHNNTEEYILPGADLRAVKEYESRILDTGVLSQ